MQAFTQLGYMHDLTGIAPKATCAKERARRGCTSTVRLPTRPRWSCCAFETGALLLGICATIAPGARMEAQQPGKDQGGAARTSLYRSCAGSSLSTMSRHFSVSLVAKVLTFSS
jgi:hypothetical protein